MWKVRRVDRVKEHPDDDGRRGLNLPRSHKTLGIRSHHHRAAHRAIVNLGIIEKVPFEPVLAKSPVPVVAFVDCSNMEGSVGHRCERRIRQLGTQPQILSASVDST